MAVTKKMLEQMVDRIDLLDDKENMTEMLDEEFNRMDGFTGCRLTEVSVVKNYEEI
jgi:hypothetical protein